MPLGTGPPDTAGCPDHRLVRLCSWAVSRKGSRLRERRPPARDQVEMGQTAHLGLGRENGTVRDPGALGSGEKARAEKEVEALGAGVSGLRWLIS